MLLRGKHHKALLSDPLYLITENYYPDGHCLFQDGSAHIYSAQGPTEWLGEKEYGLMRFWSDVFDSVLHHQCQNTNKGNIFLEER